MSINILPYTAVFISSGRGFKPLFVLTPLIALLVSPMTIAAQSAPQPTAPVRSSAQGDLWFKSMIECTPIISSLEPSCERACASENPFACSHLANAYLNQKKPDANLAAQYAEKACAAGDALLCLDSGWWFYYTGKKENNLPIVAKHLFLEACKKGDQRGCEYAKAIDESKMPQREQTGDKPPPSPGWLCPDAKPVASPGPSLPAEMYTEFEVEVPAKLVSQTDPVFPENMRRDNVDATVLLIIIVNDHGAVSGTKVIHSTQSEFDESALKAASQRQYQPALRCGKPVTSIKTITIKYKTH